VRAIERETIQRFLYERRFLFKGNVLDFGCGAPDTCAKPRPYEDIVIAGGGKYYGFDPRLGQSPAAFLRGPYDAVLCTQVIQYVEDPGETLIRLRQATAIGGHLVMTYPTTWQETEEPDDYWRFTKNGMAYLLATAGWTVVEQIDRGRIEIPGWPLVLGHGVVAKSE
jgi:SAM-dependent methyltransferase